LTPSVFVRSPRPRSVRARFARNCAVKSYGGTKSKRTFLAEMRRFVPIFSTNCEISFRDFAEAIFSVCLSVFMKSLIGSFQPLIRFRKRVSFSRWRCRRDKTCCLGLLRMSIF